MAWITCRFRWIILERYHISKKGAEKKAKKARQLLRRFLMQMVKMFLKRLRKMLSEERKRSGKSAPYWIIRRFSLEKAGPAHLPSVTKNWERGAEIGRKTKKRRNRGRGSRETWDMAHTFHLSEEHRVSAGILSSLAEDLHVSLSIWSTWRTDDAVRCRVSRFLLCMSRNRVLITLWTLTCDEIGQALSLVVMVSLSNKLERFSQFVCLFQFTKPLNFNSEVNFWRK